MVVGSSLVGKMEFSAIVVQSMGPSVFKPSHGRMCWLCSLKGDPSLSQSETEEKGSVNWPLRVAACFLEVTIIGRIYSESKDISEPYKLGSRTIDMPPPFCYVLILSKCLKVPRLICLCGFIHVSVNIAMWQLLVLSQSDIISCFPCMLLILVVTIFNLLEF